MWYVPAVPCRVSLDDAKINNQPAPGGGVWMPVLQRPVPAGIPTEVNRTMLVIKSVHMPDL